MLFGFESLEPFGLARTAVVVLAAEGYDGFSAVSKLARGDSNGEQKNEEELEGHDKGKHQDEAGPKENC
jgi:hypothetical protein